MLSVPIYIFAFVLLSCSGEKNNAENFNVYARVGEKILTDENFILQNTKTPYSKESRQRSVENWVSQSLLISEAEKEGFQRDLTLIKKRDAYYNQLIVSSFVESRVSSQINISKENVRAYYKKNKDDFVRKSDEVQIEQYIMESKKEARKLALSLNSRKNTNMSNYSIRSINQKTIKRGFFPIEMDGELFVHKTKAVGPVLLGGDICILRILNRYKKGSSRGLDEVYDEIYQRLYKTKSIREKNLLLDSLKRTVNIFINPEYQ